jgi:hypothetical protein
MTFAQLRADPAYRYHHAASRRGYVSRRGNGVVKPYKGRFGEGYIVLLPRWDTTSYVHVVYYIKVDPGSC